MHDGNSVSIRNCSKMKNHFQILLTPDLLFLIVFSKYILYYAAKQCSSGSGNGGIVFWSNHRSSLSMVKYGDFIE